MCKCLQYCLETCYWHLIEKRFCYDESIALYEEPAEKEEKNNNFFDNMAFYDSVSVIAGRAVVTITPLPEEKPIIVQQPRRRLRWDEEIEEERKLEEKRLDFPILTSSRSVPIIHEAVEEEQEETKEDVTKSDDTLNSTNKEDEPDNSKFQTLKIEHLGVEIRRKSLRERRMSKSLYLKIDHPKEIPIIRQQSMPKFYLDTPDESQTNVTSMFRAPSTVLTSPVPNKSAAFVYDLYSVVQMERERAQNMEHVPLHKESSSSRLMQIKEKIKLRRVKSSLGPITNLPHSHQHI